jgi:hypothetical protein
MLTMVEAPSHAELGGDGLWFWEHVVRCCASRACADRFNESQVNVIDMIERGTGEFDMPLTQP